MTEVDYLPGRSSVLTHKPSGVRLETPLLVPSFSSKGFSGSGFNSEVAKLLSATSELVTEVYLISAYDVGRKNIPTPSQLPVRPELIFLDSGGYEISPSYDMTEVARPSISAAKKKWSEIDLRSVLASWPKEIPAVFVSYDNPQERFPIDEQISRARDLFRAHGAGQFNCLLLKEEKASQTTLREAINSAIAHADQLRSFDIIGVTEKGLASSPIERMLAIARLRRGLDEVDCTAPIHVFGSLDPLSICLYTLAGAEIFDGLTWLRYAFADGRCVYPHSHATLQYGLHHNDTNLGMRVIRENYHYLINLQANLREFVATKEFRHLPHREFMEDAFSRLKTRMLKNGRRR
jgi:hypothetical protein